MVGTCIIEIYAEPLSPFDLALFGHSIGSTDPVIHGLGVGGLEFGQ